MVGKVIRHALPAGWSYPPCARGNRDCHRPLATGETCRLDDGSDRETRKMMLKVTALHGAALALDQTAKEIHVMTNRKVTPAATRMGTASAVALLACSVMMVAAVQPAFAHEEIRDGLCQINFAG